MQKRLTVAKKRICVRCKTPIISEVLQIAIMKMNIMGDDELAAFLNYPRQQIMISENVARQFKNESLAELKRNPGDEIIFLD